MNEELYFNDELRKCLNAAGLSDCGENDAWNYWYQRVHKAHDQAVDRVTEVQRAENAKLRELVRDVYTLHWNGLDCTECPWFDECDTTGGCPWLSIFADHMRELGVEVDG